MIVKIKEIDTNKTIMNDVLKHYNVIVSTKIIRLGDDSCFLVIIHI